MKLRPCQYRKPRSILNFWRDRHLISQANNYLTIADYMGFRGVRYAASDAATAERLTARFEAAFPEAVASGRLSVWWVPLP